MKTIFFLLVAVIVSVQALAQLTPATSQTAPAASRPENLEVRDSSGMVYPLAVWQQLVMSGKYGLKMMADRKTALLTKLTDAETEARFSRMPKPAESKFFTTGNKIASFSERDMNGNKFNLKELAGKVVAINFWFINCGPCRREMPEMNEMVEGFKDNKDVVFIAISLDEKYAIQDFLKTNPFIYNIIDNGRYIASKYGVTLYPTHVILNREGKVVFHTSGVAPNTVSWVKKSIETALNDPAPPKL